MTVSSKGFHLSPQHKPPQRQRLDETAFHHDRIIVPSDEALAPNVLLFKRPPVVEEASTKNRLGIAISCGQRPAGHVE
jgi:hypothetical protein